MWTLHLLHRLLQHRHHPEEEAHLRDDRIYVSLSHICSNNSIPRPSLCTRPGLNSNRPPSNSRRKPTPRRIDSRDDFERPMDPETRSTYATYQCSCVPRTSSSATD